MTITLNLVVSLDAPTRTLLESLVATIAEAVAALTASVAGANQELAAATARVQTDVTALGTQITGLEAQIADLKAQVAAGGDPALVDKITALTAQVETLRKGLSGIDPSNPAVLPPKSPDAPTPAGG